VILQQRAALFRERIEAAVHDAAEPRLRAAVRTAHGHVVARGTCRFVEHGSQALLDRVLLDELLAPGIEAREQARVETAERAAERRGGLDPRRVRGSAQLAHIDRGVRAGVHGRGLWRGRQGILVRAASHDQRAHDRDEPRTMEREVDAAERVRLGGVPGSGELRGTASGVSLRRRHDCSTAIRYSHPGLRREESRHLASEERCEAAGSPRRAGDWVSFELERRRQSSGNEKRVRSGFDVSFAQLTSIDLMTRASSRRGH